MFTPGLRACGYKSVSGRHEWPNRDPLQEKGGLNLYSFCENDANNNIDPFGESTSDVITVGGIKITIVLDGCKVKEIDVKTGLLGGQIAELHAKGDVSYAAACPIYNSSGSIPIDINYLMSPPPTWFQRKRENTQPISQKGSNTIPLCCGCSLKISWDISGSVTVIVNF